MVATTDGADLAIRLLCFRPLLKYLFVYRIVLEEVDQVVDRQLLSNYLYLQVKGVADMDLAATAEFVALETLDVSLWQVEFALVRQIDHLTPHRLKPLHSLELHRLGPLQRLKPLHSVPNLLQGLSPLLAGVEVSPYQGELVDLFDHQGLLTLVSVGETG